MIGFLQKAIFILLKPCLIYLRKENSDSAYENSYTDRSFNRHVNFIDKKYKVKQ